MYIYIYNSKYSTIHVPYNHPSGLHVTPHVNCGLKRLCTALDIGHCKTRLLLSLFTWSLRRPRYPLLFGIYLFAFYPFLGLPQGLVGPLTPQACRASLLNTNRPCCLLPCSFCHYVKGIDPGDLYHACYTVFRLGSGAHKDPSHSQ